MRLSPEQSRLIVTCVRAQFGQSASVKLFGSRLDDKLRGGDVDLLVESAERPTLRQQALATMALEEALELPVDIVAVQRGKPGSAFARMVQKSAQALDLAA